MTEPEARPGGARPFWSGLAWVGRVTISPDTLRVVRDPETFQEWFLDLQYDHSETEGPLFDEMDARLEAIASMTGMSGIFKLRGADVYRVLSVRRSKARDKT